MKPLREYLLLLSLLLSIGSMIVALFYIVSGSDVTFGGWLFVPAVIAFVLLYPMAKKFVK